MSRILCALLLSVGLIQACYQATAAEKQPNFLIMIADDLCWRDLGYEGNREVKTPNLDALRGESIHLKRMFNPATSCSPTRHALYTGLYPIRSGAYPNHTKVFDGTKSLFTFLKEAGYRVALQNKEHVGPNGSFPYEHIAGADDLTETKTFMMRKADQPWFMVYASNHPHSPWSTGPQVDPDKLTIPPYLHDNKVTRTSLAKYYGEITALDTQVGNLMSLLESTQQRENTVVLFVSEQGSSFPYGGKWSVYDNGIHASAILRWPGKVKANSTTTALMQYVDVAPTFLAAAGLDPNLLDPNCPDASGNRGFDGKSFLPLLKGEDQKVRDYVFAQHTTVGTNGAQGPYPMRAVRDQRYKLIRNLSHENPYAIGGIHKSQEFESWKADLTSDPTLAARIEWLSKRPYEELYDIDSDPFEMKNRIDDPSLGAVKVQLQNELNKWMAQQGDKGLETEKLAPKRQGKGEETDGEPKQKKKAKAKAK